MPQNVPEMTVTMDPQDRQSPVDASCSDILSNRSALGFVSGNQVRRQEVVLKQITAAL